MIGLPLTGAVCRWSAALLVASRSIDKNSLVNARLAFGDSTAILTGVMASADGQACVADIITRIYK